MKNKLIITAGGKGGTGKSVALLTLADYLKTNGVSYAAIDADTENSGKASAFSSYLESRLVNLRSISDCDKLLEIAAENEITLADTPANASGDIMPWFDSVIHPDILDALNLEITILGAITPEAGSFASLCQWAAALQDKVQYVVALNWRVQKAILDKEKTFSELFSTKAGKAFQTAFSPKLVEIPWLYEGSMLVWARSNQLPSEAAINPNLPILDRARIKTWVAKTHESWRESL